jgi:hypothetical protein
MALDAVGDPREEPLLLRRLRTRRRQGPCVAEPEPRAKPVRSRRVEQRTLLRQLRVDRREAPVGAPRADVRDPGGGDLREPIPAVPRLRAGRGPVRQDDRELGAGRADDRFILPESGRTSPRP